jgi:hypothetical protein
MELLAAAVLISTVLYLVDKNQKWSVCWKVVRWLGFTVMGVIVWGVLDHYVADVGLRWMIIGTFIFFGWLFEHLRHNKPETSIEEK